MQGMMQKRSMDDVSSTIVFRPQSSGIDLTWWRLAIVPLQGLWKQISPTRELVIQFLQFRGGPAGVFCVLF